MSIILRMMSCFAFFAWTIFMGLLKLFLPWSNLVKYLDAEVTAHRKELKAIDAEQARALEQLRPEDRVYYWTHSKQKYWYNTPGSTANNNYWRAADPAPYAALYRKSEYTPEELECAMDKAHMPRFFREDVRQRFYAKR